MITFAELVAPLSTEEFFKAYYDRKPVHIKADAAKRKAFQSYLTWQHLNDVLSMTSIWSHKSMELVLDRQRVPVQGYCNPGLNRDGLETMIPDAAKVMGLLKRGASLVCNDIDTLIPGLRSIAAAIEDTYDAKVQGNLYCSWKERQAFHSHYDTHDVIAVHFVGEKIWNVYENRAPHPIRHDLFNTEDALDNEQARGPLMMEVTMKPGDILYLPRGWYHDAIASDEAAVHIAFGATSCIGVDFLEAMLATLIKEQAFRTNLPRRADGEAALNKHLTQLGAHFATLAKNPELARQMAQHQANFRYPRGDMTLASNIASKQKRADFTLTSENFKIVRQNNDWVLVQGKQGVPLPPEVRVPVKWILDKKSFALDDLRDAFPWPNDEALDTFIQQLTNMRVIRSL